MCIERACAHVFTTTFITATSLISALLLYFTNYSQPPAHITPPCDPSALPALALPSLCCRGCCCCCCHTSHVTQFVEELAKLQDRVPAFSADKARAIIEADLGQPVSSLFKSFDTRPIAAASLGQVQ